MARIRVRIEKPDPPRLFLNDIFPGDLFQFVGRDFVLMKVGIEGSGYTEKQHYVSLAGGIVMCEKSPGQEVVLVEQVGEMVVNPR